VHSFIELMPKWGMANGIPCGLACFSMCEVCV